MGILWRCRQFSALAILMLGAHSNTLAQAQDAMPGVCDQALTRLGETQGSTALGEPWRYVANAIRVASACPELGPVLFQLADQLKTAGNVHTAEVYEGAIAAEPDNVEYEIDYADYLRNFRGPLQPLFPEAEEHYYQALRKLQHSSARRMQDPARLRARVIRGLTALYERDGLPLLYWRMLPWTRRPDEDRPLAFFSTQNRAERAINDFDQFDEVRDLTTAALFASGNQRLNGPLTDLQLRTLIHRYDQFETFDRLRLRYRSLPSVDVFYDRDHLDDAQNTNYFQPGVSFNNVDITRYGVGIERTVAAYPYGDFSLRTDYNHGERTGLIEFRPHDEERFNAVSAAGVFSRFWGPDKLSLDIRYFFEDIDQHTPNPIARQLEIVGTTFRYQQYTQTTFERAFNARASEFFTGVALGQELFGDVRQNRDDFFAGLALRGLSWFDVGAQTGRFDFIIQPTVYNANRTGRESNGQPAQSLANTQYRTAITLLYRLKDYENEVTLDQLPRLGPARLSFLNLVFPLAHDTAVHNLDAYNDFSLGAELAAKLIGDLSGETFFGATLLATAGYTYERFYNLGKDVQLLRVALQLGF